MWRALCRFGTSGGVQAGCCRTTSACRRWWRWPLTPSGAVPPVLAGRQIAALAITEPGGGSDVAAVRTTARREGGEYVVDGEKIFITSGMRADWITVAVRTGEAGTKVRAASACCWCPATAAARARAWTRWAGCARTPRSCASTACACRRATCWARRARASRPSWPTSTASAWASPPALGFAEACYDEALAWARQRKTFGQRLTEHQVIRHRLVDMQQRIRATAAWLEQLAARADAGDTGADWVAEVCTLKNQATQTMQFCADAGVQILGGMGYMRGTVCERIYREVKVITIGGGTEEIMKELAARQWGL
jgi:acyl-CoA dehydrogenase